MKLLGKRVLLSTPKRKESIIELTPETERAMDEDMIKLWTALEVYAIGTDVTLVKAKDKVYVSVSSLSSAERIVIANETKLLVNEFEVVIIWDEMHNMEKRVLLNDKRDVELSIIKDKILADEREINK
jgi:hypothetical protein